MILRLDNGIHTYYGLVHMLHGESLAVERGEVGPVRSAPRYSEYSCIIRYSDIDSPPVAGKSPSSGSLQVFKAEFFRALAHPVRIRILEILVDGERSVQELQEALRLEQPIVSQQLAMLRAKNVVKARKEGTTVRYTIRDGSIRELLALARRIFDSQLIDTQTMLRELRREGRSR